jgi:hypothetical protein
MILPIFTFTTIGALKNPKAVAERAAKRMVHGDQDPWRKQCESYGFLLAKSMIIMDSEIHRERMKPQNINNTIGLDAWEYANDRVIGTGKGWNYNVITQQNGQRVGTTGEFTQDIDDSLARDTIQQRDTSFAETSEVPVGHVEQPLTEENVVNYADFNADREVLRKEYSLSKGLLDQAASNITPDYFKKLSEHKDASSEDLTAAHVFVALISHLNGNDIHQHQTWDEATQGMDEQLIESAKNILDQIEDRKYDREVINNLKEEFKDRSDDKNDMLHNIKEYLCEAFCLVEIIEELNTHNNATAQMVRNFPN